jgi:hypothetical protein
MYILDKTSSPFVNERTLLATTVSYATKRVGARHCRWSLWIGACVCVLYFTFIFYHCPFSLQGRITRYGGIVVARCYWLRVILVLVGFGCEWKILPDLVVLTDAVSSTEPQVNSVCCLLSMYNNEYLMGKLARTLWNCINRCFLKFLI